MKKFIIVLSCFLLVFSCKKKEMDFIYGEISSFYANGRLMPRNGFDLKIRAGIVKGKCIDSYYYIGILHDAKNDTLREGISISGLPLNKLGKIPLTLRLPDNSCDSVPTAQFYVSSSGGDVTLGEYFISKKSDSFVNIESYDANTKEVKGTFDITFVADGTSERVRRIYSDTIRFDKAKFSVIIN